MSKSEENNNFPTMVSLRSLRTPSVATEGLGSPHQFPTKKSSTEDSNKENQEGPGLDIDNPNSAEGIREKQKEAVKFVVYELQMLWLCCRGLEPPPPEGKFLTNLLTEGMVLHARVLRDFFFTKLDKKKKLNTRDDDIVATHYCPQWSYTSDNYPTYLKENKEQMDRALAHLSYDRLTYDEDDQKVWSPKEILEEISRIWSKFLETIQTDNNEAYGWFIGCAPKIKAPIEQPPQDIGMQNRTISPQVANIVEQVKNLTPEEHKEFLSWLAEYNLQHYDDRDR